MPDTKKSKLSLMVHGRFTLLLIALLLFFLIHPLMLEEGIRGKWLGNIFVLALLLTSLRAVHGKFRPMKQLYAVAVVSFIMDWIAYGLPASVYAQALQNVMHVAFFSFVALLMLRYVFQPGSITFDRISAAICVYLLLGLMWAEMYEALETLRPGSFFFPDNFGDNQDHPLTYFSFITMTTLGYGDVLPVHGFARSLAFVEAVVGQLYLAILIGRLVASFVGRRPGRVDPNDA